MAGRGRRGPIRRGPRGRPAAALRPHRRQPPGPVRHEPTPPSTTSSATAALSANPVGRLVLAAFGAAGDDRARVVRLHLHRPAAGRALAGRRRGRGRRRVYLPQEDLDRFGVDRTALHGGPPADPALRALMVFEVARARRFLDERRPLIASLHGLGPLGGRRLLGRRSRSARRHRRRALRRARPARRTSVPRRHRHAARPPWRSRTGPRPERRSDERARRRRGLPQPASRSPAPRPGTSPTASSCCPSRSARPCPRCTPWPGASTTSATATLPAPEKLTALAQVRKDVAALGDVADGTGAVMVAVGRHAPALSDPDGGPRRADRRVRDGRAGDALRDLRRPGRLLPAGRRHRRPAQPRRLRLRRNAERAAPLADDLGVALQITNILRDVVEDHAEHGPGLPAGRTTADRFGVPARTWQGPPTISSP